MSKLPKGWVSSDIGSICQYIQRGKSPEYDRDSNNFPVINQKCIRWGYIDPKYLKFVTPNFWKSLDDIRFLQKGDILWNSTGTGTLGRAAIFSELLGYSKAIVDSHVTILRTHTGIDPKYLYYWIQSPYTQNNIERMQSGTTNQVELSKGVIQNAYIYLAPKNEQKQITEKLDQVFAELDSIKTRLDKIHIILKSFRQSIYNSAVTGHLSKSWRDESNVPSADDLREMIYNEYNKEKNYKTLFTEKDTSLDAQLPKSWTVLNLDKICLKLTYGSSQKSQKKGDVPVLRMGNIQGGTLDWKELVYSSDKEEIKKYKLHYGDVLFNRTNSPELVGKTAVYRSERDAIYAGYLIKISPSGLLNPEYLNMCLNSSFAKDYCWKVKTDGVSQSNINAKKLGKMPIPFCSIQEQDSIVEKALELFSIADQIEEKYDLAMQKINAITQSVLNKAFHGKLLPQNPDDEHASILLERIKKEKQYQASIAKKETRTKAKKSKEVKKMISPVLDTLQKEKKPLTAQNLLEKSGYPHDSDPETIERFFLDIKKCLIEGTVVRERVQDEDVFKLVA